MAPQLKLRPLQITQRVSTERPLTGVIQRASLRRSARAQIRGKAARCACQRDRLLTGSIATFFSTPPSGRFEVLRAGRYSGAETLFPSQI